MKLIREHDDFEWIRDVNSNPFEHSLSVVFLNKQLTKEEAGYIMDLVDAVGAKYNSDREMNIDSLVEYSPGGYVKTYINTVNVKRFSYGDSKRLFEDYKWINVLDSLEGMLYAEFMVTDILPKRNINEGDDWDWVQNQDINPWLEYDTVNFDIVPWEEDVARYIELALSTRAINNWDSWTYSREEDIESIIDYANKGNCYLNIGENNNNLSYGSERYYPKDKKIINYSTLIGKPLNEEDEFDWIRNTQPWVPFEEAQIGQRYNIEKDEVLLDALNACDEWDYMYHMYHNSVTAEVTGKGYNKYSNIYCGSENDDEVITLKLTFYDEQDEGIEVFWVTEDMVTLYPMNNKINESEDEFDWIKDVPVGIELEPNTLYYFDPPLSLKEIPQFANRIINSNSIKKLLLDDFTNNLLSSGDPGVNYFVTKHNLERGVYGWCSSIDIEGAIDSYPRQNPVNARKEFYL